MSSPSHPASDEEPATSGRGDPIRTLLWTAATARPLAEVAALVGLIRRTPRLRGRRPAATASPPGAARRFAAPPAALRGTAGTGKAPHAAAAGRPTAAPATPSAILGPPPGGAAGSAPPAAPAHGPAPAFAAQPHAPAAVPLADPAAGPRDAPAGNGGEQRRRAGSALRWVTAGLLPVLGLIQLPADPAGLPAVGYTDDLSPALAVVCVALSVLLALRDAVWVWALVAVAAVAALLLHALTALLGTADLLRHSVGSALAGSGAAQAACAALAVLAAALAAAALLGRPRPVATPDEA
ncbi:hypothetical protein [Streptomyces sp. NPDC049040]|uniref:hypothetical protein n=1 Tax=Streptomyces sp. NPDC049040 TaxID=3365593 RepID=UPI003720BC84